jgi:hypothetical protein
MKIFLIIVFLFMIFSVAIAQELSLDDFIKTFSEKSAYQKIEKIENTKLVLEKKGLFFDKWLKLNCLLKSNNIYYPKGNDFTKVDNIELYSTLYDSAMYGAKKELQTGNTSLEVYYNFLYFSTALEYANNSKPDQKKQVVGVFKELSDFFYSENKYKRNLLPIKQAITKNTLDEAKEKEKKEIIDLYVKILNTNLELTIKQDAIKENNKRIEILKARSEDTVPFDIEYVELQNQEYENDINFLIETNRIQTIQLFEKVGMDSKEVLDIKLKELDDIVINDLQIYPYILKDKNLEIQKQKEYIKYVNRLSMVSKTISANYDPENSIWTANLSFGINLFDYNADKKIQQKQMDRLEVEKIELEKEFNRNKILLDNEYVYLEKKYETAYSKKMIFEKRKNVAKELFERGYMSLIDYFKEKQNYTDALLFFQKSKNELNGFKYKFFLN